MKRFLSEIFLFVLIFYNVVESIEAEYSVLGDDLKIRLEKWYHINEILQATVQRNHLPQAEHFEELPIHVDDLLELEKPGQDTYYNYFEQDGSRCTKDLNYLLKNLDQAWALEMMDSFGKPGSGILLGNFVWPGQYDECLKTYAPTNKTDGDFHGKYCQITWSAHLPGSNMSLPLKIGACLPDRCSAAELTVQFAKVLHTAESIPGINKIFSYGNFTRISCKPTSRTFTSAAIFMMFLLTFFGVLILFGSSITAYEYFQTAACNNFQSAADDIGSNNQDFHEKHTDTLKSNEKVEMKTVQDKSDGGVLKLDYVGAKNSINVLGIAKPFLKCFCIFSNGSKIFNTEGGEGQFICLHGIRFLSLTWVILGHMYAYCFSYIRNPVELLGLMDNFAFQIVLQGFFSVDSFFVLSGFLLTYLFFKEMTKRNGKMSWAYFYLHRYFRLTPVYMIVLGFNTTILRYVGEGPYWIDTDSDETCEKYWWKNLLYINNFSKILDTCVGWSWYLSNDMQFYVISPLFLYTLWRWPKIGLSTIAVFMCSSCITIGVITYKNDLFTGMSVFPKDIDPLTFLNRYNDYYEKIYITPYARIGPYLIGMLLGYYFFKTKDRTTLSRVQLLIGWILATSLALIVIYGLYHTNPSVLTKSVYNAFSRISYAICLSWVIYVCLTSGGIVNSILSFKAFIPLSRLTYCAYLVHPMVLFTYYQVLRQPLELTQFTMVALFLGLLAMCYGFALVTTLMFESPIMGLEKEMMKKFKKS